MTIAEHRKLTKSQKHTVLRNELVTDRSYTLNCWGGTEPAYYSFDRLVESIEETLYADCGRVDYDSSYLYSQLFA